MIAVSGVMVMLLRALIGGMAGSRHFLPDGICRRQVAFRLGLKPFAATSGAEVIGVAAIVRPMLRRPRIDIHAADRIFHETEAWSLRGVPVVVISAMLMVMLVVRAAMCVPILVITIALAAVGVPVGLVLMFVHDRRLVCRPLIA